MTDQPDGAGHHAEAAGDPPVEPHLAAERAQDPGRIARQVALARASRFGRHELDQADVGAVEPGFLGDLDQPRSAWVNRFMEGMPDPGDDRLGLGEA